MSPTRSLARPLLASIFVTGGLAALRSPGQRAEAVKQSGLPDKLPDSVPATLAQPQNLVRLNGAAGVLGGFALATGRAPRLASLGLAASLIPTTYVGHPFWAEKDKAAKAQQQVHFFKNLAIIGGLLLSVADTGGRESVPHAAGRLTRKAKKDARKARIDAAKAAHQLTHSSHATLSSAGSDALSSARKSAAKAQKSALKSAAEAQKAAKKKGPKAAKAARKSATSAVRSASDATAKAREALPV